MELTSLITPWSFILLQGKIYPKQRQGGLPPTEKGKKDGGGRAAHGVTQPSLPCSMQQDYVHSWHPSYPHPYSSKGDWEESANGPREGRGSGPKMILVWEKPTLGCVLGGDCLPPHARVGTREAAPGMATLPTWWCPFLCGRLSYCHHCQLSLDVGEVWF